MAGRILPSDKHGELERVSQAELRKLFRRRHGRDHVLSLNRLLEDPVRAALRGRGSSSLGAERLGESNQPPSDRVEGCTNLAAGEQSAVPVTRDQRWRQARRGSANDAEVDDERRCVPCCGGAGLTGIKRRG